MESDSDQLVNEIMQMLEKLEPPPTSECCIYRVPEKLRKLKEEAYTPHVVSIGPFHRNNKNLDCMDQVKKRYMKKFLGIGTGNSWLKICTEFVKNSEARIRNCYSEHIKMESDEFVKMILVDSCFIIEFLNSCKRGVPDDPLLFLAPGVVHEDIHIDLILLENQVPFFVLEGLYRVTIAGSFHGCSFLDLTLNFLKELKKNKENNFQPIKHLTDLLLTLWLPSPQKPSPPKKEKFRSVFSSTELHEAGVTFQKSSSDCLFGISFKNGVLTIPSFPVDDDTETYIRNLMALEVCQYPPHNRCISDYILFMDCLINTTRDVELLVHNEIIVNCLGDNKAVADLFNNLCVQVPFDRDNFYFSQVCYDLNKFYKTRWHRLKAALKRDYFCTPWRTSSTIAAITLLVLTFIQTVCSVLSTIRKN